MVTVSKKEVVAAASQLEERRLPSSNLDLHVPPVDVGVFFCYKNPSGDTFGSMVGILKKALGEALVSYYAFSGQVVANSEGEPELLCDNRGVEFLEAYADVELRKLNVHNPDESIEGKLVPKKKHGVLAVQATEMRCGGIIVACTFDHRIADAYSANMFFVSWSEMARSKPPSALPSFERSLLNPRHPGSFHPSLYQMYVPLPSCTSPPSPPPLDDLLISRIYYVTANYINELQSLASPNHDGGMRTKLQSFSAFLWKLIAISAAKDNATTSNLGIVVDGRRTMFSHNEMKSYFGNVLSVPFAGEEVDKLTKMPLSWVAKKVHDEILQNALTKDHFLDLIDLVEVHRPERVTAKVYASGGDEGSGIVVSSGQHFPIYEVDFGWGRPVFGSYHFPWGGKAGYVMPMPSPVEGDWIVYMHLMKKQLEVIECEGANVFEPLTFNYLDIV